MDIASFLFGIALGLTIGGLVAWFAGRVNQPGLSLGSMRSGRGPLD
jgi:hypothetical protein